MNIWDLWSKTDREHPENWHALPWHMLEVGVVAEQIWRYRVAAPVKTRLARRLGVEDSDLLARWVGFVASIHDVGKASPKFQGLVPVQVARLKSLGIETTVSGESLKHGLISAHALPAILIDHFGMIPDVARRYAYLTGGHHGTMWSSGNLNGARVHPKLVGRGDWVQARQDIVIWLAEAFLIPATLPGKLTTERLTYEDAIYLAGLITAADWLGSDENYFTYRTDTVSSASAREIALTRANTALGRSGWYQQPLSIAASRFSDAIRSLPPDAEPYPAQQVAVDTIRAMDGPGITIVEYPMGWGKTEIALWAAAHWAETSDIPGFYIAMPTMATSDQLHERVTRHLATHLGAGKSKVNLQLLHGQANLGAIPDIAEHCDLFAPAGKALAKVSDPEDGTTGRIRRMEWFTRRKRGLLATYGVGTVDQVLMAVLETKHFFVRTHGLGGKTVIFDEVHSYDAFMNEHFDAVLHWLGALGSPVMILSATLPTSRTRQMIDAYRAGAGWNRAEIDLAPYPRITATSESLAESVHGPSPENEPHRNVSVRMITTDVDDDAIWAEIGPQLDAALTDGGTAAVICNTVRQAQAAYRALGQWFPREQRTLFHARFRQMDRRIIQDSVLHRFGKQVLDEPPDIERPARHVVIATQVIEQSLDLDFDLMVSLFCPTDLLLQRAGRMQRHRALDALRPKRFRGKPELWIAGVNVVDDLPVFSDGTERVYAPHVLIRSWAALCDRVRVEIPGDVEALIEMTYDEHSPIPPHLETLWRESEEVWREAVKADSNAARIVEIPSLAEGNNPKNRDVLTQINRLREDREDDPFLHSSAVATTRLGDASISLVILTAEDAERFADAISPERTEPLSPEEIRPLLLRTVGVSLPHVTRVARDAFAPRSWETSAYLRHHRLVVLTENNRGLLGDMPVAMHPELGVLFDKDVQEGASYV